MNTVLSLDQVNLVKESNPVLQNISWTLAEGENWVVLGPNGAGKTSLLEVAAARTRPTAGGVQIFGQDLAHHDVSYLRSRLGFCGDSPTEDIPPQVLVRDAVLAASRGRTQRWHEPYDTTDENRAEDLLAAFGMTQFAQRRWETLSAGERKRVQIARALMADPEVLFLDEPTAALDIGGREELLYALTEIAGDSRSPALVLVTHQLEEIPPGITHALLLQAGQGFQQGPITEVLNAQNLSEQYGLPLTVTHVDGRWQARRV